MGAGEQPALARDGPHVVEPAPVLPHARRPHRMLERHFIINQSGGWMIVVSGFFESLFYLLSIRVGFGSLRQQQSTIVEPFDVCFRVQQRRLQSESNTQGRLVLLGGQEALLREQPCEVLLVDVWLSSARFRVRSSW